MSPFARRSRTGLLPTLLAVVLAYLYGSLPFVYLLGRLRNVDLKETGSGNVGSLNLYSVAGARVALLGWMLDVSKGFLPVLIARRLHLSPTAADLAGVAGAAGQCWPITLGMSGGRGVSAYVGASVAMDRIAWLGAIAPLAGGGIWRVATARSGSRGSVARQMRHDRSRSVPFAMFVSAFTFPLACAWKGHRPWQPPVLLSALILLRRLTAPQPDDAVNGPARNPGALVYRLLYDRNTAA